MSEKRFIVGETLCDYYQIKCEKKDYSRVLAPNTVARLLNEQQATISRLEEENIELKKLRKYCAEWMGVKEENLYDVVR